MPYNWRTKAITAIVDVTFSPGELILDYNNKFRRAMTFAGFPMDSSLPEHSLCKHFYFRQLPHSLRTLMGSVNPADFRSVGELSQLAARHPDYRSPRQGSFKNTAPSNLTTPVSNSKKRPAPPTDYERRDVPRSYCSFHKRQTAHSSQDCSLNPRNHVKDSGYRHPSVPKTCNSCKLPWDPSHKCKKRSEVNYLSDGLSKVSLSPEANQLPEDTIWLAEIPSSGSSIPPVRQPVIINSQSISAKAQAVIDSGASISVVSPALAQHLKVQLIPDDSQVLLANGSVQSELSSCYLVIRNGTTSVNHLFRVMPLADSVNVLLGIDLMGPLSFNRITERSFSTLSSHSSHMSLTSTID
jgi:predicted aspartyl protease